MIHLKKGERKGKKIKKEVEEIQEDNIILQSICGAPVGLSISWNRTGIRIDAAFHFHKHRTNLSL